jgi:ABC-type multidrug transport system ATPase subunit
MYVLQTNGLSKYYGNIRALDNLQLEVKKGDVLGLLGPNGSGKTTTLSLILGIVKPNMGSYIWFEGAYENPNLKIGSILETPNHYTYLSGWENLRIVAHIKKVEEAELMELAELVGLKDRIHSKVKTYSLGMRQRLAIACSLVGDPELLIFDEPTNGLDPQGIAEVRDLINKIAKTGKTIILASHILSEVEKICSHTAILNRGRLIASGRVEELLKQTNTYTIGSLDQTKLGEILPAFEGYVSHKEGKDRFSVELKDNFSGAALNDYCYKNGLLLSHLTFEEKRLEDAFMEMLSSDQIQQ